jgi:hypothetical protein
MLSRHWIRPGPALESAVDFIRSNVDIDRIVEKATDH